MRRTTLDKFRENLRLQQVYNVLLRYGWDIAVYDRWESIGDFHRFMQRWIWGIPKDPEPIPTPVKVRMMLEELGPTYVKMGQIVSSQSSAIPPEWEAELEKLQSDVPPFPLEQVREVIFEELKAYPEDLYAAFESEPFAAASTAQVHRAILQDGSPVAVKVQRPYIYNQMKADIGIMQNAARVVTARSEQARSIDLVGMLEQFGDGVLRELDYNGETYNALRLEQNLAGIEHAHVPTVHIDLSTSKVLTLEFVQGVKVSNVDAIEQAGLDRKEVAHTVLQALIKMLMIDGFFHADPHPGNVLVNLQTGDVTFIDTGMVGELDLQQRLNLIQLLIAIRSVDIQGMAQILKNMSVPFIEPVDEKGYYRDFERTIGRFFYSSSKAGFGEIVSVSMNLLREYGLRLNPNLTMAVKALMQAEAIATSLAPEGGMLADGIQIIQEEALQVVTADRIVDEARKQLMNAGREFVKNFPDLSQATFKWISQYKKGRFEITVDTSELSKEVDKLGKFGRQVVIAILLVGLLIGSSIATAAIAFAQPAQNPSQFWTLIFNLSYFSFIIAVVIALIILVRLVWRWMRGYRYDQD
jgi:ubiquinone biosynthesis protein